MIQHLPGWTVVPGAEGYTLFPAEGPTLGAIRYRERMRPLRRAGDLVRERLAAGRAFTNPIIAPLTELVTHEGEYAALITVAGQLDGRPAQRDFGFVFGDDFYARLEGVCTRPAEFARFTAAVRELILTDSHALAERRRRFRYTPAAGWTPIVRGFETDWLAPRFPLEWAMITVFPANPGRIQPAALLPVVRQALERGGYVIEEDLGQREVAADSGLAGAHGEAVGAAQGQRSLRAVVALTDGRYVHSIEMVSRSPELWAGHRLELERFWRSAQPLPTPRGALVNSGALPFSADLP